MKIQVTSVMVDDQDKALAFYTEKLGFKKMADIQMSPDYRWLTVVSPEGIEGVELSLDPMSMEASRVYQKALYDAGTPLNAFVTADIDAEVKKLRERGVVVRGEPADMGPIRAVSFEDTCGNLIHLVQPL
ncbi:VOC family protein [Roseateles sp. DC23W]|uniref:VOC family protein n=1 Tax=Pelomonas dachongensis TaxID=3299029 RepID=A0ABW7EMI4_9BURK